MSQPATAAGPKELRRCQQPLGKAVEELLLFLRASGDQVKVATLLHEVFITKTKALVLSPSPFLSASNPAQLTIT